MKINVWPFNVEKTSLGFWEDYFDNHISIFNIVIYGENAMHWAVNIKLKKGYFCFRLPLKCFKHWHPLYCYFSPDATPCHRNVKWFWGKAAKGY